MTDIHGDKLRGHLDTMILSLLEGGVAHGFEILKRMEISGNGLLHMKEGSLYPALYRLESAGLIAGSWEDGANGRRGARRRFYRLTPKGKRQLQRGREEWKEFVKVVGTILLAPT